MCHVLIIEDEPLVAMAIEMALEDAGATSFDIAENEQDAVSAARMRRPDVITSDVKLKAGTGPLAVQAIRLEQGNTPVIFVTGSPDDCEPCDPPDIILTKPFNAAVLMDAFRRSRNSSS
jgi:CheY-like chemotaxis protein